MDDGVPAFARSSWAGRHGQDDIIVLRVGAQVGQGRHQIIRVHLFVGRALMPDFPSMGRTRWWRDEEELPTLGRM